MTRIRLKTGPTALFGAVLVLVLIVLLPMRLALGWFGIGDAGLSARAVYGSVWNAQLNEAHVGDVDLGTLQASLSPFQLLVGRAKVNLSGQNAVTGDPLRGAIGVTRHSFGLDDVSATMPVGAALAPVPISTLMLDDVSVRFTDGACDSAEGRVRATLLGAIGGVALPQAMSGTARCDGESLLLPLTSAPGTEALTLAIGQSGGYRAELRVQPTDPGAARKLALAGFQPSAAGYTLAIEGNF